MKVARKIRRRGRPPADEGGLVRERLLEYALSLFAKRGFDATSVRDIAAAADVSDSALYAHFATKRELYEILLEEAGPSAVTIAIAKRRVDVDDPARFIRGLVDDLLRIWSGPRFRLFTSMLVRELATCDQIVLQLRSAIETAQTELAEIFGGWRSADMIRCRSTDLQLAWELVAPLMYIRMIYLQTHAAKSVRARALDLARDHANHFIACSNLP